MIVWQARASLDGKEILTSFQVRDLDTGFSLHFLLSRGVTFPQNCRPAGFAAIGANDWFPIEFRNFSVKKAGDQEWGGPLYISLAFFVSPFLVFLPHERLEVSDNTTLPVNKEHKEVQPGNENGHC